MITLSEVKSFLGISGTEKDSSISALIPSAESVVLGILGIDDFLSRSIEGERISVNNPCRFFVKNFPVDISSVKVFNLYGNEETTGFFQDFGAIKKINVGARHAPQILHCGEYTVDYTAGWENENAVPKEIKNAISLVVSSLLAEQDTMGGSIESYSIPDVESVKFRQSNEFSSVKNLLKKWL